MSLIKIIVKNLKIKMNFYKQKLSAQAIIKVSLLLKLERGKKLIKTLTDKIKKLKNFASNFIKERQLNLR